MADRDKVIKALEICFLGRLYDCVNECPYYPYFQNSQCTKMLCGDTLSLLKEQEARVIPLSELFSYPAIWEFNTPPYLCTEEIDAARMWWRTWRDTYISITGVGTMGANNYGKEWRCWTAWPTEEQRKAVKWDD